MGGAKGKVALLSPAPLASNVLSIKPINLLAKSRIYNNACPVVVCFRSKQENEKQVKTCRVNRNPPLPSLDCLFFLPDEWN
jgi:hypothetical protein